ncbi:WD40 repeat-containing protein [Tieghemostelium lacteum]|uniref:WD40 repeat-containing protein n=1 Tax=Tieghemostelium lacteum TaxID=361077 RepID=A0A151Z3V3_TIELA|nr:WD40 repeat-containing protein [Tieghemostelium lacteum]|eukprot:KYQ88639.1 WD40 repeat-containing protein [Tieghemostelium lacteum]
MSNDTDMLENNEIGLKPAWVDEDDSNYTVKPNNYQVIPKWAIIQKQTIEVERNEIEELITQSNFALTKGKSVDSNVLDYRLLSKSNVLRAEITVIKYHRDGELLLVCGSKGTFAILSSSDEFVKPIHSGELKNFHIRFADFVDGRNEIVIFGEQSYFYIYNMDSRVSEQVKLRSSKFKFNKYAISGDYIATVDVQGTLSIVRSDTRSVVHESILASTQVSAITFSPDGNTLFLSYNGQIHCFSMTDMKLFHKFKDYGNANSKSVTSIAISDVYNLKNSTGTKTTYLCTGSEFGYINSYDLANCMTETNPKPLKDFDNLVHPITSIHFHPSSSIMVAFSKLDDNLIRFFQYPSHHTYIPTNQTKQCKHITALDFSPLANWFTIGNSNGTIFTFKLPLFK